MDGKKSKEDLLEKKRTVPVLYPLRVHFCVHLTTLSLLYGKDRVETRHSPGSVRLIHTICALEMLGGNCKITSC